MKYTRIIACALMLALLSGCSIMPFTTPEEQRAAQEAAEALRQETQVQVDPLEFLQGDLEMHRTLTTGAGTVLADYRVAFPFFSHTGQKAQSFERINKYYQNELTGLVQDAESLFEDVKAFYGEEWNNITEPTQVFNVEIDYQLLETPAGYLCVRCDFHVEDGNQKEDYTAAQVFLLDNGWRLTLETLLGSDYETAAPAILEDILDWCREKGIDVANAETRTLEEFSANYALTSEGFIFYTQPFQLSNKNANRYSIPVAIGPYRQMLE